MPRDPVRKALAVVLDEIPVSIRQLARRSGVSHTLLLLAKNGETRLAPETVRRVVAALREMGGELDALADKLEAAAEKEDR